MVKEIIIASDHAGVELKAVEVFPAPVFCKVYAVTVAEAHAH